MRCSFTKKEIIADTKKNWLHEHIRGCYLFLFALILFTGEHAERSLPFMHTCDNLQKIECVEMCRNIFYMEARKEYIFLFLIFFSLISLLTIMYYFILFNFFIIIPFATDAMIYYENRYSAILVCATVCAWIFIVFGLLDYFMTYAIIQKTIIFRISPFLLLGV